MNNKTQLINDSLSRINDWIKVADSKAAAIGAFLAIYITALLALIYNYANLYSKVINKGGSLTWLMISTVALTLTLYLLLRTLWFILVTLRASTVNSEDNPLFFADIAKLSEKDYLGVMNKLTIKGFEGHLINQVYTNATIATKKYKYINQAILSIVIATIFLIITASSALLALYTFNNLNTSSAIS